MIMLKNGHKILQGLAPSNTAVGITDKIYIMFGPHLQEITKTGQQPPPGTMKSRITTGKILTLAHKLDISLR